MTQSLTVDQFLAKKKPATRKVTLVLDQDLAAEWNQAKGALALAKQDGSNTADAEAEVGRLRGLVEKASVEFVFRSIGRNAFRELLEANPPTSVQLDKAKAEGIEDLDHNPDTFPQALVAAALESPNWSLDDVEKVWAADSLQEPELTQLYTAALLANRASQVVDLGKD